MGPALLIRGLIHRAGTNLVILLIALVASAAASIGPAYYDSARDSILHDSFANAALVQRGMEVTQQGSLPHALGTLTQGVQAALATAIPDPAQRDRLFGTPIEGINATVGVSGAGFPPLVWRSDYCQHLPITSGRCATAPNEVIVSTSFARTVGVHLGQRLTPAGWPTLTIVGVYAAPDITQTYWHGRGGMYFPVEYPVANAPKTIPYDALFTAEATIDTAAGNPQGTLIVDQQLNDARVSAGDLTTLDRAMSTVSLQLSAAGASVTTQLPALDDTIRASWQSLLVPIFLITVQLLLLIWLVMFLVVRNAVDARGPQIALMRLRGRRGLRLLGFALSEPIALLAIALPVGVIVGQLLCALLNRGLLRGGTPTYLPALSWAAAGAATLGGLVAVVIGGWRTVRRSVVGQWQHASREATRRGWLIDAITVTAAAAGVVELYATGQVSSVHQGSLVLLVPGLLGIAGAVLGSRLLPVLCRAAFPLTGRRGSLGPFLAVRHVARRSEGVRTTIVLATAFALAAFAIIAWSTGRTNRQFVAEVGVGAPTVLSVTPPSGIDLGALVDRLDPGGQNAAVVDSYLNATAGDQVMLAVDPQRFAHVAAWRSDFAPRSLAGLMNEITPKVAPSLALTGDQIRVRLHVDHLDLAGLSLVAYVASPGAAGPVYTPIGTIESQHGAVTLTAQLDGCPCTLRSLSLSLPPAANRVQPDTGTITLDGIDVHGPSGWAAVPGAESTAQWRAAPGNDNSIAGGPGPVSWSFGVTAIRSADLLVADLPAQLPAVFNTQVTGPSSLNPVTTTGLDTNQLVVRPVAIVKAVPGTVAGGMIVNRTLAERAANGTLNGLVAQQVWTTDGAAPAIEAGLRAAHVNITEIQTAASQAQLYDRAGPGLASVAFAAAAIAAAVLAAFGALMSLVSTGRRRRFEYAALEAVGATRRTLFAGLLLEQLILLVFGAVTGTITGIIAAVVTVRNIPEFVSSQSTPPLSYALDTGVIATFVGAAVGILVIAAVISSWLLVAGVRSDDLRGTPE